jgi:hypothetical protein
MGYKDINLTFHSLKGKQTSQQPLPSSTQFKKINMAYFIIIVIFESCLYN